MAMAIEQASKSLNVADILENQRRPAPSPQTVERKGMGASVRIFGVKSTTRSLIVPTDSEPSRALFTIGGGREKEQITRHCQMVQKRFIGGLSKDLQNKQNMGDIELMDTLRPKRVGGRKGKGGDRNEGSQ